MKYHYYPGCSLEGTAREYDLSTRAVMGSMGAQLMEIEDWTCCGASAAESISYLLSMALPARNLAIAEKQEDLQDILVPCSACYLNLKTGLNGVKIWIPKSKLFVKWPMSLLTHTSLWMEFLLLHHADVNMLSGLEMESTRHRRDICSSLNPG